MVVRANYYFRPEVHRIEGKQQEKIKEIKERSEQLAPNMWALSTRKRYRNPGYVTQLLIQSGKEHYFADIPTNAKGVIAPHVMAERLMDLADGDRTNQQRNIFVDVAVTAKNTTDAKNRAKSYLWYIHPNEGDIKGIDDANSKIVTVLPSSTKARRRSFIIMGGTQAQTEAVAKAIDKNFTAKEKQVLAGVLFHIKGLGMKAAGTYHRSRVLGAGGSMAVITIDPHYATDEYAPVTVHEAVHALRDRDPNRVRELKRRGGSLWFDDSDLEESLTEGETVGRQSPMKEHEFARRGGGYYAHLRVDDVGEAALEDRAKITKPKSPEHLMTKGRKGKTVQKMLVKVYPETNISKLKLQGRAEAIDTYWRTMDSGGRETNMQVYSPKAKKPEIAKGQLKTEEFRDGKAVVISKRKLPRMSRRTPSLSRRHKRL